MKEKKKMLDRCFQNSKDIQIKVEEIYKMLDNLVNLKHNGKSLKNSLGKLLIKS